MYESGEVPGQEVAPLDAPGNIHALRLEVGHRHNLVEASHCHRAQRARARLRLAIGREDLVARIRAEFRVQFITPCCTRIMGNSPESPATIAVRCGSAGKSSSVLRTRGQENGDVRVSHLVDGFVCTGSLPV